MILVLNWVIIKSAGLNDPIYKDVLRKIFVTVLQQKIKEKKGIVLSTDLMMRIQSRGIFVLHFCGLFVF